MKRFAAFLLLAAAAAAAGAAGPDGSWKFAVSGDSRNCGDVVMPAIAAGATADGAAFYWHLGDYRALYDFDRDVLQDPSRRNPKSVAGMTISDYLRDAWDDFIQSQLVPFGKTPVFLAIGNHELVSPKTRPDLLVQFADWFDAPEIQAQRLKDDPKDRRPKTWYHWVRNGVDFIALDNASHDQFEAAQLKWLEKVLARDGSDPAITTIVAGMHAALPDSVAMGHSMNDWAQGEASGRRVYALLLAAKDRGKKVYVLASHSHFYMKGIFETPYWRAHGGVLPGWIVGTAGAVRYRLPAGAGAAEEAKTDVYGWLAATVAPDGTIRFDFRPIEPKDVPADVLARYGDALVRDCFEGNRE
jgi:hypothetical protein